MQSERLVGSQYPISLGSAMVFENGEFDITKWPNLLYINLRTLFRNYVQSYPREMWHRVDNHQFAEHFLEEVKLIESIVRDISHQRVRTFFYYPTYQNLNKVLPKSQKKVYNTEEFDAIEQEMWNHITTNELVIGFFYQQIDTELPPANEPVLLWSSFVVDLLSASKFPMMYLLESFTGKIKKRQEWYTKVNFGKVKNMDDVHYPFTKFTMQIFGDKSGFIKGSDVKLRRVVREMAKNDRWTPVTGIEKIKYSISRLKDFELKELLYSFL